jgi:hypothetical protein
LYGKKPSAPPPSPPPLTRPNEEDTALSTVREVHSQFEWLAMRSQDMANTALAVATTASDPKVLKAMWKDAVAHEHPWLDLLAKAGLSLAALGLAAAAARAFAPTQRLRL